MTHPVLSRRDGALYMEDVSLSDVAAAHGTPCYVYSARAIRERLSDYQSALTGLPHTICYAVKANSNLAILAMLARAGAGFDIVSGGELQRVLLAGGNPNKIVFSGVGKTRREIQAALQAGIGCFNVESAAELELINAVASEAGHVAPISLRVNPDVDAHTHPYIATGLRDNKFGVAMDEALPLYRKAAQLSHLEIRGVDCHIGSQLTTLEPFIDATARMLQLVDQLAAEGIRLQHIDLGGGLGVRYRDEQAPAIAAYLQALRAQLGDRQLALVLEPGRSLVAEAGVLLMEVLYLKPTAARNFALVDAAMNDMLRPALYQAWMDIVPLQQRSDLSSARYDVVGPVCETGDFLGKDRELAIAAGDLLAMTGAGAYGFTMSSNYNTRPRAAEVLVAGDTVHLVRERESLTMLMAGEHIPSQWQTSEAH
jgi:diaminopimelate decarboxylase